MHNSMIAVRVGIMAVNAIIIILSTYIADNENCTIFTVRTTSILHVLHTL